MYPYGSLEECPRLAPDLDVRTDDYWRRCWEKSLTVIEARLLGLPLLVGASIQVLSKNDEGPFVASSGRFVGAWPDEDGVEKFWAQNHNSVFEFDPTAAIPTFSPTVTRDPVLLYASELAFRMGGSLAWWPLGGGWQIRLGGGRRIEGDTHDDLMAAWLRFLQSTQDPA